MAWEHVLVEEITIVGAIIQIFYGENCLQRQQSWLVTAKLY